MRLAPLLFLFLLHTVSTRAAAVFYFDKTTFDSAVSAAGLASNLIDFESVPAVPYPGGLTTSGVTFRDASDPTFPRVFPEAQWGQYFASGTGNTLAGLTTFNVSLPAGVRAFGANVGQTAIWAVPGLSSSVQFRLPTGEARSTVTDASHLFPFFGFVSDVPVTNLQVGFGVTFITMDNVTFATTATPEPSTAILCAGVLVIMLARLRCLKTTR